MVEKIIDRPRDPEAMKQFIRGYRYMARETELAQRTKNYEKVNWFLLSLNGAGPPSNYTPEQRGKYVAHAYRTLKTENSAGLGSLGIFNGIDALYETGNLASSRRVSRALGELPKRLSRIDKSDLKEKLRAYKIKK